MDDEWKKDIGWMNMWMDEDMNEENINKYSFYLGIL